MTKRKEALYLPGHRSAQDAQQRPQAQHHTMKWILWEILRFDKTIYRLFDFPISALPHTVDFNWLPVIRAAAGIIPVCWSCSR